MTLKIIENKIKIYIIYNKYNKLKIMFPKFWDPINNNEKWSNND